MMQGRNFRVFWVVLVIAILFPVMTISAEPRLHVVAKPPKLNGGVTLPATPEAPVADNPPLATPQPTPAPQASATPQPVATPQPSAAPVINKQAVPGGSVSRTTSTAADATGASVTADPTLVALGALGASNLYFSYLTLGTVADGYVSGTYEPQVAISVANESIFMNTTAKTNLDKLLESAPLAKEDKEVVSYMTKTYDILIDQAKALVQFISNQKDDGSSYQKYRTEAWKRIVELFGIK